MNKGRFVKGQRVRVVKCYQHPGALGQIVTLTTDYQEILGGPEWGYFTSQGLWGEDHQFAPLDDDSDYKRFMERALKPVDLVQPVTA